MCPFRNPTRYHKVDITPLEDLCYETCSLASTYQQDSLILQVIKVFFSEIHSDRCDGDIAFVYACGCPNPASDRKSTRLNSSHANISYAVFCLKKKIITSNPHNSPMLSFSLIN